MRAAILMLVGCVGSESYYHPYNPAERVPERAPDPPQACFNYEVMHSGEHKTICKPTVEECMRDRAGVARDRIFGGVTACERR